MGRLAIHFHPTMKRSASSISAKSGIKHPTVKRAQEIDADPPYLRLHAKQELPLINSTPQNTLHWFRTKDLRVEDNIGFCKAMKLAADNGKRCHALFVLNKAELKFQGVGNSRNWFMAQNISVLTSQLKQLGVKLTIAKASSFEEEASVVLENATRNNVSHVFANYEYEVDELERDLNTLEVLRKEKIDFRLFHDQTVTEPGTVNSTSGSPLKVFTPFWRAWTPVLAKNNSLYTKLEYPEPQSGGDEGSEKSEQEAVDLYSELEITEPNSTVVKLWPAGHDAALDKLKQFIKKKIHNYHRDRSNAALDCTSRMSPYFAMGIISVREALKLVREEANNNKNFGTDSDKSGVDAWVREIAFREFYRQMVACAAPHIIMNMPSSLRLSEVRFEEDEEGWKRWCEGKTGFPFVDAGMRQLNTEGYMHNRLRMNVSSFLRMNLLLDYRLGMTYFSNNLVDWDPCNNAYGWDPSYTVFNPVLQAEKNDPKGDYIRRWVPELKDVQGKAVFDPHGRLSSAEFKKLNYPAPAMDLNVAKDRAMQRFKETGKVKKEEV